MDYKSALALKRFSRFIYTVINPSNTNSDFFNIYTFEYLFCKENKIKNPAHKHPSRGWGFATLY